MPTRQQKMHKKSRILFSLFDQSHAARFGRQLAALGWEIVATRETAELLNKKNVPFQDFSKFFSVRVEYPFPPTLHPSLELALTTEQGKTLDAVYITTYPLSRGNDVGGHTILGLGAKGQRIVVTDPGDMARVIEHLQVNENKISDGLRQQLIAKAYSRISRHYGSLACPSDDSGLPAIVTVKKAMSLLEGENPYQVPCDLFEIESQDPLSLPRFKKLTANLPCFTNMADFDCILNTLCLLAFAFERNVQKVPFITLVAKHGNPCGLAVDWDSPDIAIQNALWGHPPAVFGGEVITNFPICAKQAELLFTSADRERLLGSPFWSLDLLVAPDFDKAAVKILSQRPRLKLFQNPRLARPRPGRAQWSYRMVRGGILRQPPAGYILDLIHASGQDTVALEPGVRDSLIIAWATAFSSNHGGNEIALAKDRKLLGAGGGPATVDACRAAVARALANGHGLKGAGFCADASFPFNDGPRELLKAGCRFGVAPGGGKNFESVKKEFADQQVRMFYLPEKIRGFCRH